MFESENEQQNFLVKYNISQDRFRNALLSWDTLREIADDFEVHSLNFRVKETEHLIEKIIRKNGKYLEQGKSITKDNYKEYITDLMGLRILILFKEDWKSIHDFLTKIYKDKFIEEPFVYIRKGDKKSYYEGSIKIIEDKPYRSVHYTIRNDDGTGLEIQVRTLFEEAWSEVDHKIRYPYKIRNEMMNGYLEIMNRAAGMADEMGTFINSYIKSFEDITGNGVVSDNDVYNYIIERLSDCNDEELKEDIVDKIKKSQEFKQLSLMSDTMKSILDKM
jgi:ppGpp synthetase/RelA/SpoT-type nucleotidyltranferase